MKVSQVSSCTTAMVSQMATSSMCRPGGRTGRQKPDGVIMMESWLVTRPARQGFGLGTLLSDETSFAMNEASLECGEDVETRLAALA